MKNNKENIFPIRCKIINEIGDKFDKEIQANKDIINHVISNNDKLIILEK